MKSAPAIRPDNPAVEQQRAGWCVEIPSAPGLGYLFACEIREQTHGMCIWAGGGVGFCRVNGPIKVFSTLYAAQHAAGKCGGKTVTVPRRVGSVGDGAVLTWDEVPL